MCSATYKKILHHTQQGLLQGGQDRFNIEKLV